LIRAAALNKPEHVVASSLSLQGLFSIGKAGLPLEIQAAGLTAMATVGEIRLNQSGQLVVDGPVSAGKSIGITGDSAINILSDIQSAGPISISTLPGMTGESRIFVGSGGSVVSKNERVSLVGGDGLSLLAGSLVASLGLEGKTEVLLASLAGEVFSSEKYVVSVDGAVTADEILVQSRSGNHNHYLNLDEIRGQTKKTHIYVDGISGNNTLTIDDLNYSENRRISIDDGKIETPAQLIQMNAIDNAIMSLGSVHDFIEIGQKTGLKSISIDMGPGDDQISTVLSTAENLSQRFDGGSGRNRIKIDAERQATWSQPTAISAISSQVTFQNFNNVTVGNSTAMSALPVADQYVDRVVPSNEKLSNSEYVMMVYRQVLNRNATAVELSRGTRQLENRIVGREQFASRILISTESLNLQVQAWFTTYFNRQPTSRELSRNVAALRNGQPAASLITRLLMSQEFYNRTQQFVASGSPADRYITGIYKLVINPAGMPDAALMQFLRQQLQRQGRAGVAANVVNSMPSTRNQTQSVYLKVNHQPADRSQMDIRINPIRLSARLLSRK
jgi:hypothetical protein